MSQRRLLIVGIAAIAASLLLGVAGTINGVTGSSMGGMMGGLFNGGNQNIGIERAVTTAQGVAGSYSGGGLAVDEVIEFSNNYYASIREKSTGVGAFEILIDKSTGNVMEEPPSMISEKGHDRGKVVISVSRPRAVRPECGGTFVR